MRSYARADGLAPGVAEIYRWRSRLRRRMLGAAERSEHGSETVGRAGRVALVRLRRRVPRADRWAEWLSTAVGARGAAHMRGPLAPPVRRRGVLGAYATLVCGEDARQEQLSRHCVAQRTPHPIISGPPPPPAARTCRRHTRSRGRACDAAGRDSSECASSTGAHPRRDRESSRAPTPVVCRFPPPARP